jgi:hypothetical protein
MGCIILPCYESVGSCSLLISQGFNNQIILIMQMLQAW